MRRKGKFSKIFSGMLAGAIGIASFVPSTSLWALPLDRMTMRPTAGEITVSPEIRYQTLKGWGTSLCWWGNIIGSWGDADYNDNGRPDREEIAELAFSPEYLNLNIVRYNVGGGDKEDTSIKRCEGLVPGWTEDMTGTKDGTGAYDEAAFLAKPSEEMADAGQIWMLEQANRWRKEKAEQDKTANDIINEVFSNSPPYYMTKSGSSTGGNDNDWYNLKDDCYDDFAVYMARAAKWIDKELKETYGTGVDYIEPLNEPDTNYWMNGSTKQEGCIFSPGELQSREYREMRKALDAEGLEQIQMTGTDETALSNAIGSFYALESDVKQDITTIGAHTYSGNDGERKELRRIAQSYDKDLWMSEVTKGGGGHSEARHNSMEAVNAKSQSEGIMADLKYMQLTAWIAWLLADSEYECIQTDSNWGLLHAVFEENGQPVPDYHTNLVNGDGSRKDGVPGEGYWAVTKQFYTMMQYSRFLKAGYTMIDVADGNMCAALAPDGSELVIVAQNFGDSRKTTVDLGKFTDLGTADSYRTSDNENCEKVDSQDVRGHVLEVELPKNSVTTYVIKAQDGAAVCNMANASKTVDADVVQEEEAAGWTSDADKFAYTDGWGESGSCDGKYTEEESAAVTFTFEGERAVIYGTKDSTGATVSVVVDGGQPADVSLHGQGKDTEALLYDTGRLASGRHTVTMTNHVDGEKKLLEVNYARIVSGEYRQEQVQPCDPVYTVSGIKPILPETVSVISDGEAQEKNVTWNLGEADFSGKDRKVTLRGNVSGTAEKASIDVYVAMENAVYMIDCNAPESPEMQYYADLLNETADQKYGDGNTWGYVGDYVDYFDTSYDDYNMYKSGWYVDKGTDITQPIQYQVRLAAGDYTVTFGLEEWWAQYNSSREMDVFMQQGDGAAEKIGTTNTFNGNDSWNTDAFTISCAQDTDVLFQLKPVSGEQEATLAFIQIQKKLDLGNLKAALRKFEAMDEGKYLNNPEGIAALKNAAADGHRLLYASSATQESVDAAAAAIDAAREAVGKIEVTLDKQTLAKNDYVLYTVNCGTPDVYKIPNPESERLGLLQSCVDQALGEDEMTGYTWGA